MQDNGTPGYSIKESFRYRRLRTPGRRNRVKFLLKSIGATALGFLGGWLGGLIGFSTGFYIGIVFSIVGWYLTKYLCDKHLLGEHVEHHMFVGCILKHKSLNGYIANGLLEPHTLYKRHEELVKEMKQRNFKHNSDISQKDIGCHYSIKGCVNQTENLKELTRRCPNCAKRINNI